MSSAVVLSGRTGGVLPSASPSSSPSLSVVVTEDALSVAFAPLPAAHAPAVHT